MQNKKSARTARLIRQRRKHRGRRQGSAQTIGTWMGCSVGIIVILMLSGVLLAGTTVVAVYAVYARQLPPAEALMSARDDNFETTIFYDRTGNHRIFEVIDPNGGDRQSIALEDIPPYVSQATIAIEDASFYTNPGFDLEGIARAAWVNLTSDRLEGGSTITQQLVRNQLLSPEERAVQTVDRKLKEIILAAEVARLYDKNDILEMYLNTNFYGNLAYGIEAAAQVYFAKSARDLTLAEAAMLAAVPQSPALNPLDNPDLAVQRQRVVLREMVNQGYITQEEAIAAENEVITLRTLDLRFDLSAPHFSQYARQEAERRLNELGYDGSDLILGNGLRIYTTLDLDLQLQLECTARTHVTRLSNNDPTFSHNTSTAQPCAANEFLPPLNPELLQTPRYVSNASGVMMRAETGEIVAMLGSLNYWDNNIGGQFNAALAQRQPASTFKPFVYVSAFNTPLNANTVVTPATMTYDVLTEFNNGNADPYIPYNIDRRFNGPVSIRNALARSYNVPAVQVLNWVGLREVLNTAHFMGINSMNENISNYGLSLALGTAEASLLDMTYAYNTFNNNGTMVGAPVASEQARIGYRQLNPVAILRIEDANGRVLWSYGADAGTFDRRAVLEPGMAYMITDILSDNDARISNTFAPGNPLELNNRAAAAKTGTSDDFRDSWTIGYTPQYTLGVWVGNNNNIGMENVTGSVGAAPIWHAVMEYVHTRDSLPAEIWPQPATIVTQDVCEISGLLPNGNCFTRAEIFYYDQQRGIDYRPNQVDFYWETLRVNTCNNTLAVTTSPPDCVSERPYFRYPDELLAWATETGQDLPPENFDTVGSTSPFSPLAVVEPTLLAHVRGTVEVRGNVRVDEIDYYILEAGRGPTPDTWRQIGDRRNTPGGNIVLTTWDTTTLSDGVWTLRLTLVRTDGSSEVSTPREVIVDNTPPTVTLLSPMTGRSYSASEDVFMEIVAEPSDNQQTAYVDFYRDDEYLGRDIDSPYLLRWQIEADGSGALSTFRVVVGDRAGNETESATATVQLAP
jgi:membrane peptidoglycan carboxypeptidase